MKPEDLRDKLKLAEDALRTIASIKCRCDAYVGPCGCGDRAVEIAEEVIGCKACFASGRRTDLRACLDCNGTGIAPPEAAPKCQACGGLGCLDISGTGGDTTWIDCTHCGTGQRKGEG